MKNFEKYEKELKEAVHNAQVTHLATKLSGRTINDSEKLLLWLCEEYKEPLLTYEEREYLKAVIKPYREDFDYLYRSSISTMTLNFKNDCYILISQDKYFQELNMFEQYTLEDLGL